MGNDNPQNQNLELVQAWLKLAQQQIAALKAGDFAKLEQLITAGSAIQARLEQGRFRPDANSAATLRTIEELQAELVAELSRGSAILGEQLPSLRRNLNAIGGYRQQGAAPSFLNRRT